VSPRPVDLRPDPEALLREAQAAERGQLKVFLGYASGVGKSFRMFDEGRRRRERGEDVVVAAVQPDVDDEVRAMVDQLETIPPRIMDGVELVDLAAVLARRPAVCVVDGLASGNPPAAANPTRYEDVQFLITAGISVLTAVNLEDIEEQQEFIERLTGRRKRQTVPQEFLNRADEVVVVDAPTERDDRMLSELRQRALLLAADVAERQLDEYLRLNRIQTSWGTQERILVCMTPRANAAPMLASGRRNADRFHGELFAVYVTQKNLTPEDRSALARNVMLARAQQAQVVILEGSDPILAILDYARVHGITQLFVGHNLRRTWRTRLAGSLLDRLIRDAEGMDVRVFPH
jgi:two-component system sensor histidine kinase KdpD